MKKLITITVIAITLVSCNQKKEVVYTMHSNNSENLEEIPASKLGFTRALDLGETISNGIDYGQELTLTVVKIENK